MYRHRNEITRGLNDPLVGKRTVSLTRFQHTKQLLRETPGAFRGNRWAKSEIPHWSRGTDTRTPCGRQMHGSKSHTPVSPSRIWMCSGCLGTSTVSKALPCRNHGTAPSTSPGSSSTLNLAQKSPTVLAGANSYSAPASLPSISSVLEKPR